MKENYFSSLIKISSVIEQAVSDIILQRDESLLPYTLNVVRLD